jgi:hypothetical protein
MIIKQGARHKPTEFYTPRRPCRTCGTSHRYQSTGHCVACKRAHDLTRKEDRRSKRARAMDMLERKQSIAMREFPRAMQNAFLRAHYPNWRQDERV